MILCDYGCNQEAKYKFKNGKWCCNDHYMKCEKIKKSGKNHPSFGKKYSEETKEKLRKINTGKKHSEETKRKISESNKGRKCSDKTKKKIGDANRGRQFSLEFKKTMSKIKTGLHHSDETKEKISKSNKGKKQSSETKKKIGDANRGRKFSLEMRNKISISQKGIKRSEKIKNKLKLSIKQIKQRYPLFSQIEEMRYEPGKEKEKVIQVHCKNHLCPNSKEQGGWFTPTKSSISDRISCLDRVGVDNCYFYCSDKCKNECPLYRSRGADPFKNIKKNYLESEYQQFRDYVLERDDYKCQYCGEKAEHVHHERPQKLEPFYSLDPDLAWSVCSKCHYEKGHKDECSTGVLANKICK